MASVSNPMPLPMCTFRGCQSPKKHPAVRMSMKYVYENVNGDVNAYGMYMGENTIYGFH